MRGYPECQAGILKGDLCWVSRSVVWTGHSHMIPMESMGSELALAVLWVRSWNQQFWDLCLVQNHSRGPKTTDTPGSLGVTPPPWTLMPPHGHPPQQASVQQQPSLLPTCWPQDMPKGKFCCNSSCWSHREYLGSEILLSPWILRMKSTSPWPSVFPATSLFP